MSHSFQGQFGRKHPFQPPVDDPNRPVFPGGIKRPNGRPKPPAVEEVEEALRESADVSPLLLPAHVANLLGVGVRTLERWRISGEGPQFVRLSRRCIRYREAAVVEFIRGRERSNTGQ